MSPLLQGATKDQMGAIAVECPQEFSDSDSKEAISLLNTMDQSWVLWDNLVEEGFLAKPREYKSG